MPNRAPQEFREHQMMVLGLLNRARPLLNKPDAAEWAHLGDFRNELTRALAEYQRYKHTVLYDPVIAGETGARRIAVRLKADCVQLGVVYQAFTMKWKAGLVKDEWPKYRLEALSMMRNLREALGREADLVPEMCALYALA